jgi:preprotein translocase subunit SecG
MQVLNIFHVLVAIALIAFVLIQKGQGATAGAAFGSGASGTVFGARGAGNFLSRTTWVLAALFCTISLVMAVLVSRMMSSPDVGLGVVGSETSQPTAIEQVVEDEPAPTAMPSVQSSEPDMPVFEPSADDLPAIDASQGDAATAAGPAEEPDSGEGGN